MQPIQSDSWKLPSKFSGKQSIESETWKNENEIQFDRIKDR
jgi:hypothetical protein